MRAYRGSLAMAFTDFKKKQELGVTNITPGQDPPARAKKCKPVQADGGLVFRTDIPMPMYLGEYWKTKDVDDIVPAEYLEGRSSVNKDVLDVLAEGFPDVELIASLTGVGVSSKDKPQAGVNFLATNHAKATHHHHLVDKMYQDEIDAGRMVQFALEFTPVFAGPAGVYPTGATPKTTREGKIDETQIRPTADYSWVPLMHWLSWLIKSPNSTVDLEQDFPWVYYATTRDYMDQVVYLQALGGGVV